MVSNRAAQAIALRGHAEENFLPLGGRPSNQPGNDPPHHRERVRLFGIKHSLSHRPTRFDVKNFGEFFRVVARHYDIRALHFVTENRPIGNEAGWDSFSA
jgi:hypothetical protein